MSSQAACRVDRHPVGRPARIGEFGEHRDERRADGVQCPPAADERVGTGRASGVQAGLHRGGRAHHDPPGRAALIEVGLHRGVTRQIKQPGRMAMRIGSGTECGEPGDCEPGVQQPGIGGRGADTFGEAACG